MGSPQAHKAKGNERAGAHAAPVVEAGEPQTRSRTAHVRGLRGLASMAAGFTIVFAVFLGWGFARFGSPANALAYVGGARLLISPHVYDCEGKDGDRYSGTFVLTNLSDRTVRVLGAKASCDCVATKGLPMEIPAGRSASLPFALRLDSRQSGALQNVKFITDSPVAQEISGRVRGHVVQNKP